MCEINFILEKQNQLHIEYQKLKTIDIRRFIDRWLKLKSRIFWPNNIKNIDLWSITHKEAIMKQRTNIQQSFDSATRLGLKYIESSRLKKFWLAKNN